MNSEERQINQLLIRLQAVYPSLKRAERSAADLILHEPEWMASATIGAAAERLDISQPTFVRLAKRLGYTGFAQMKKALSSTQEDQSEVEISYQNIDKESTPYDVAQSVVQASIQALTDLSHVMKPEDYQQAAAAITQAGKVLFVGAGDSGIVARSAFQKFSRTELRCNTAEDFDTQLMLASLLSKGDVCVLISHSGDTASMMRVATVASESGATTIAITNFPYSHLGRFCDILLLTATFVECGGEIITKRIAQLSIIESLFICYQLHAGCHGRELKNKIEKILIQYNKL